MDHAVMEGNTLYALTESLGLLPTDDKTSPLAKGKFLYLRSIIQPGHVIKNGEIAQW